ncbi:hypothetical protein CBM2609_P80005 [Cupriavidus taiwanensis]|uniref:Uncharacterized protein n=1 Tax=Cupriavidus taiwanensis TaxID=164546 RepID=A0A976AES8_9BURK|nr:hypothetical protein CBM2586_P80005 [Cupriavidus taiwanensis]SOZ07160.1 hypothetical protein CBM2599_P70005 [Cupriavidus taiwanensis]SOZ22194.1 hypothetical protein CBM2604_P90005 [Cupriavidus taiwanensis]SOZ34316.1 hypothetical protein CBM2609_P80005 [Cupriavidus taiwanensis]SOZ52581.1 hypothetical protein CBM2610_P70005 [Cupriavidus taiwanensis]
MANRPGRRLRVPINCETDRTISPLTVRIQPNYLETQESNLLILREPVVHLL